MEDVTQLRFPQLLMEHPVASPYHGVSPHTDYFPANTRLINEDPRKTS